MQSPQAKLKEITRLLASWPSAAGEGDEQLRSYLLAVDDYPFCDVENAIANFIKGNAPGVNLAFLPPPPVVGGECRRVMNLRLESERRTKLHQPALPAPDIVHTAEDRAKVKAKIDAFLADVQAAPTDQEAVKRRNEIWSKTNARFMPNMSPAEMRKRLGFEIGDRDGAEDAA